MESRCTTYIPEVFEESWTDGVATAAWRAAGSHYVHIQYVLNNKINSQF
jgi:hypothetical protein